MARRKKEPESVHRNSISSAAQALFMEKGIEATSMDEIAKTAGYSKATLYVYFKNKEEIAGVLVLESMKKLYAYLSDALEQKGTIKEQYHSLCCGLVTYQEEFPYYFETALSRINVEFDNRICLPEERETYDVGEQITLKIIEFLLTGIEKGELRNNLDPAPVIFTFWGMLAGFIQTAVNKEDYIRKGLHLSKQEFLESGFDMLYRSIANPEVLL